MNFEKKKMGLAAKISVAMVLGIGFIGALPSVMPNSSVVSAEEIEIGFNYYDEQTKTLTFTGTEIDDIELFDSRKVSTDQIEYVEISDGVISIPYWDFKNNFTNLKSVTIPSSVESIGWSAFEGCTSLENIVLPENLTKIEREAFADCTSLQHIEIPNGIKSIGIRTFSNCSNLTAIILPDSIKSIEYGAFKDCTSLKYVIWPESVTSIDMCAFENCIALPKPSLPKRVVVGQNAFRGCQPEQN